jgi:8-oxo-dGTP pyrophosphatase MutT (NUDIX family)
MRGRRELVEEGGLEPARVGEVRRVDALPGFVVVDAAGAEIEAVTRYLRDLALSDMSPPTCRSYAHDLLRWFRLLWLLEVAWEHATRDEAAALVGGCGPERTRSGSGGQVRAALGR